MEFGRDNHILTSFNFKYALKYEPGAKNVQENEKEKKIFPALAKKRKEVTYNNYPWPYKILRGTNAEIWHAVGSEGDKPLGGQEIQSFIQYWKTGLRNLESTANRDLGHDLKDTITEDELGIAVQELYKYFFLSKAGVQKIH